MAFIKKAKTQDQRHLDLLKEWYTKFVSRYEVLYHDPDQTVFLVSHPFKPGVLELANVYNVRDTIEIKIIAHIEQTI